MNEDPPLPPLPFRRLTFSYYFFMDGWTDARTDGRTDGWNKILSSQSRVTVDQYVPALLCSALLCSALSIIIITWINLCCCCCWGDGPMGLWPPPLQQETRKKKKKGKKNAGVINLTVDIRFGSVSSRELLLLAAAAAATAADCRTMMMTVKNEPRKNKSEQEKKREEKRRDNVYVTAAASRIKCNKWCALKISRRCCCCCRYSLGAFPCYNNWLDIHLIITKERKNSVRSTGGSSRVRFFSRGRRNAWKMVQSDLQPSEDKEERENRI